MSPKYAPGQTLHGLPATMRPEDVVRYLTTCLRNLDASGAAYQDVVSTLLWLGINEGVEFGYSVRDLQNTVAQIVELRKPAVR